MTNPFAKPAFDVGFATNDLDGFRQLWEERAGLAYDHLAKLGGGFHQHRWRMGDSIIKVNQTRTPLEDAPVEVYSTHTHTVDFARRLRNASCVSRSQFRLRL